jgi:hypothetical protein
MKYRKYTLDSRDVSRKRRISATAGVSSLRCHFSCEEEGQIEALVNLRKFKRVNFGVGKQEGRISDLFLYNGVNTLVGL